MAASTSTSTSMASSSPNHTTFDVFLSFRGEDTRDSFTDHLYAGLKRAGIDTFRDTNEIRRGQELEPEIVKAIKDSKASVVVLSKNYANSTWCLDELSLILEQRRDCNHFVLPVFYHVNPADVRKQRQSFAIEAKEGVEGSKWTSVNVNRWRSALTEAANLTGIVASGSETELISKIIDEINFKLDLKLLSTPVHLTGMETRSEDVNSWMNDEHSNVLAICGMGGSGKTTLAQFIYNLNKQNFECSSYLEDIGKHCKQPCSLLELQKQLLSDILGRNIERISCVSEGTRKIEKALHMKMALIVLDDIDDKDELHALLGSKEIRKQSKIIITTRLLDIHAWFGSISWRCHVHKHKLLNDLESLELLSWHAFGSKIPMEGFRHLAMELAQYCGGNPLALKVLGSSLFVSAQDPRERSSIKKSWESRLNSLRSLKGDLDSKIQGILKRSFDALPLKSNQELFLHIAIFFVGEDEDYVAKILEHDWHAINGIVTLINRCLIIVSSKKKLMMHQLLQDMGRNIVREESKDPAKQTRVWCSDEAYCVLTKDDGSETIEGLALDTRKLKKGTKALSIKIGTLAKMDKLKLLQLKYVELTGTYKNFPELRWLSWHGCQLKAIPSAIPMGNLVSLDLSNGNLKMFEAPMVLNSLKFLNLFRCYKLVSICNFSRLPNLEILNLWDCASLTHVCETIGGLKSLTLLNLNGCKKLWKVSLMHELVNNVKRLNLEQPLFSLPRSLKFLLLDYCELEDRNVRVVIHGQSLFGLSLTKNPFEFLPSNINIKMFRVLNLSYCKNLKSILCLPSTLEELYTYGCESLEKITFESTRFRLKKFGYKGCIRLSEIQGLFKLVSVAKLDVADLGHMKWIKAYEHYKMDLVGNEITEVRNWHIKMLYEYGIMSTYLQGIKDQSMMTHEYMSSSNFLFFRVPLDLKAHRIQGLNVTTIYRLSRSYYKDDKDGWCFFAKIRNITKGVTWIYNPVVYCKPKVHEDVTWLSYWPIGNILDVGDEVCVDIIYDSRLIVRWCGASMAYMNDGEVEQGEKWDNNKKMEEVVGGDLSEFEVTTGVYYLCRRDFFRQKTLALAWVKRLFDATVHYTDLQSWRKSLQPRYLDACFMEQTFSVDVNGDTLYKHILVGKFNNESEISKVKEVVSRLEGVDNVFYYFEHERCLYVTGNVDCMALETCVREFDNTIRILDVRYSTKHFLQSFLQRFQYTITEWGRQLEQQQQPEAQLIWKMRIDKFVWYVWIIICAVLYAYVTSFIIRKPFLYCFLYIFFNGIRKLFLA